MVVNEEILSEKFREIARKLDDYFGKLNIGVVNAKAIFDCESRYIYVEYKNDIFRFVLYHTPEEKEREEQLHVTNIIFDEKIRHKGYFGGLMKILMKCCIEKGNMPILFEQVVSDNLRDILVDKYDGKIVCDDERGRFIFVLC